MKTEAWSVVFTGLSLTCITATVLFVLVALTQPKPWMKSPARRDCAGRETVFANAVSVVEFVTVSVALATMYLCWMPSDMGHLLAR